MLVLLHPHPARPAGNVGKISVAARRRRAGLSLHYALEGNVAALRLPPLKAPARAERLWEHTCFEAFVRAGGSAHYTELNFAPSGEWAAHRFSGVRADRVDADIPRPRIDLWSDSASLHLKVDVEVPGLPEEETWALGLCAVIEEMSGATSYWALAHSSAKPDFHHPGSFVLTLP